MKKVLLALLIILVITELRKKATLPAAVSGPYNSAAEERQAADLAASGDTKAAKKVLEVSATNALDAGDVLKAQELVDKTGLMDGSMEFWPNFGDIKPMSL